MRMTTRGTGTDGTESWIFGNWYSAEDRRPCGRKAGASRNQELFSAKLSGRPSLHSQHSTLESKNQPQPTLGKATFNSDRKLWAANDSSTQVDSPQTQPSIFCILPPSNLFVLMLRHVRCYDEIQNRYFSRILLSFKLHRLLTSLEEGGRTVDTVSFRIQLLECAIPRHKNPDILLMYFLNMVKLDF